MIIAQSFSSRVLAAWISYRMLFLCFAVAGLVAIVAASSKSVTPVAVSVVNVVEMESAKLVTVEFQHHDPNARFAEPHQMQIRVAGRWQPALSLPKLENGYLFAVTNSHRLIFDFPHQTEACKFLLGYRVGRSPYCQAYAFLSRHDVSKKFPKLSRAFLRLVPQQPRLRRVDCTLEIPIVTDNHVAASPIL